MFRVLPNVLKHSPWGGTVLIHAKSENDRLVLDVADTGPGICMKERPAIFDAFYSGSAPVSGAALEWEPA
jgi:K+-sensing histidine kinase KdpD